MYYEEKIINGILCYRNSPNSDFKEFTKEHLTSKILSMKKKYGETMSLCEYFLADENL